MLFSSCFRLLINIFILYHIIFYLSIVFIKILYFLF
nr:MAG TPA: hypothetical protein [Caudoviricetes sp.]